MGDLVIFVIGCGVCFIFGGGVLIHVVAGQKITSISEVRAEDLARDNSTDDRKKAS